MSKFCKKTNVQQVILDVNRIISTIINVWHIVFSLISAGPQISTALWSAAPLRIHIEISAERLITALIRIVTIFCYKLNQHAYGTSMQTIKQWKYCWYLDFFIICGLLIVRICFILILNEKMKRFRHLILFFS